MSAQNIVLTEFFTQLRKRGLDCIYTTQDWSMTDRRVRKLTTHLIHCVEIRQGVMRGLMFTDPWYRQDQIPDDVALQVKPVFSLYNTYYRVKRAPKVVK